MSIKYLKCDIELVKDITTPTNLIFHHDDSNPDFLFYEDVPERVSFGFCDLVVKYENKVIGTLSNGEISEELVKSYIDSFNIRDILETIEVMFDLPEDDSYLNRKEWEELYSKFEKSECFNKKPYSQPELNVTFFDWVTKYDDGRMKLNKYIKHISDENGKLIYRIRKEKVYTREEFVKTARWAFHFYKNDQSLSDDELEEKFEELLLGK